MVISLKVLLGYFALLQWVSASTGDRLYEFRDCVSQCVENRCPRNMGLLGLLAWDCPSDCDYVCQQALTDAHERDGLRVHQYHGKWPFRRIAGVQEPASVIFSMSNFVPHAMGYGMIKKEHDQKNFFMKAYYSSFAVVGMNTWIWSSVFHVRDSAITEKLDYFSAIGQISMGLYLAAVRLFRLDLPSRRPKRNSLCLALVGFYLCHISYLSFVRFNYAYNMMAGIVVGIMQTASWIVLGMTSYVRSKKKMDLVPIALVLSISLGSSFELNDFSPYFRAIDAHSSWHASTVSPTYFWYKWMIYDLRRPHSPHVRHDHY